VIIEKAGKTDENARFDYHMLQKKYKQLDKEENCIWQWLLNNIEAGHLILYCEDVSKE